VVLPTMLYHEIRNPVLFKEFLGHRTLDTMLPCIQTEKALFKEEADNFEVKAVKDHENVKALLEVIRGHLRARRTPILWEA